MLTSAPRPASVEPTTEYRLLGVRLDGAGPFLRETKTGAQISATTLNQVKKGDFIYSRLFAWRGAFGVIPVELDDCWVSGEFPTFRAIQDRIDTSFLNYWFRLPTTLEIVAEDCTGSTPLTRNRFKEEFFHKLRIPLPSLPEQRRIVARIEELAAKIEEAKGLRASACHSDDAMAATATERLCFDASFELTEFGEAAIDLKNGIYKPPHFWGEGTPCIRMYNIDGPGMNTRNLQLLDVTEEEFAEYRCEPGDLIFNRVNSAELVGKTGLISEKYPQSVFESKNMRIRLRKDTVLPQFAALALNSERTKRHYRSVLKQQCGMATLNQGHVRTIPFPLLPLSEQRRIVAYLDSLQTKVDELKKLQAETQAELDALLPSILDKAFKGEL